MRRILFGPGNRLAHRRNYITALTGGGGSDGVLPMSTFTFTRSGGASYYDDNGIIQQKSTDEIRSPTKVPQGANGLKSGAIFEESGANRATYSTDINGADWTDVGGNTYTTVGVTPLLSGQTTQKFTNAGSTGNKGVQQTIGTFTASWESGAIIVENVDASEFEVGVYNTVATNYAALVTLDFGTENVTGGTTGSGSSQEYRVEDLGTGPNGGQMYRVYWTYYNGGSGNGRRLDIFPTGTTTNTDSVIVHHAQLEAKKHCSSPILTTTAIVTRNHEFTEGDYTEPFQEMTIFVRYQYLDGGVTSGDRILQIGDGTTSGDPRLFIYFQTASPFAERASYDNGTAQVDSTAPSSLSVGDIVDLRVVLHTDGSIQLHKSIVGAAEASGAQSSAPTGGLVAGPPSKVAIGYNGDSGNRTPILPIFAMGFFAGEVTRDQCRSSLGL